MMYNDDGWDLSLRLVSGCLEWRMWMRRRDDCGYRVMSLFTSLFYPSQISITEQLCYLQNITCLINIGGSSFFIILC